MTRRIVLLIVGVVIVALVSFLWYQSVHAPVTGTLSEVTLVSPEGETVRLPVEVADDPVERAKGLMGRTRLPEGQGMVFMFEEPQDLSFWMKNTLIPLDILFFDADGVFVSRTTMEPCTVPVCPVYPSDRPAQWAVEVNAGAPETADVGAGWVLEGAK